MKPFRIVAQDERHYMIHDGERQFPVAKAGLSAETHAKIQRFAEGGEVRHPNEDARRNPYDPTDLHLMDARRYPNEDARANPISPIDPPSPPAEDAPLVVTDPMSGAVMNHPPLAAEEPRQAQPTTGPGPGIIDDPAAREPILAAPPAPEKPARAVGAPAGIAAGEREERAGIQAEGAARAAGAEAQARLQDESAQRQQQMMEQGAKTLAERQAKAEALFNDIQGSKVDPRHFWDSQTTGQKVMASIGLILGGIGAGITHGPNYAAETIDKAIDRDLESQKLNIGKKQSLLSHYMEQTRDLASAQRLAKADALDITAAQIGAAASRMGGQMASAQAQTQMGMLRQKAAVERQEGTLREYQIKGAQQGLQQQQQTMEATRQLLKGISGGGGFNRQILELPAFKDYRERAVDLPDGSVAFAPDKEEAAKTRESMQGIGTLKSKVQRYGELLKNGDPATLDRGTAQALRADILAEMGHLHGLNRLSDRDLELFEQQVPEISDLIKPAAAQKLKALGQSIDDKVWSINSGLLHRPNARKPGA